MNPSLRHLSFRRIGTSEVHLRYLEGDPDLRSILGSRPKDVAELLEHAPLEARRLVPSTELGDALERYAVRHGAPQAVLDSARAVGRGEAYVVVTGQQPGLFGGPLYSIHKVATAVRLARELSAAPGAPRVVPVFWNHTDDHDLDEVNRAFFVNPNMDLQRIRLDVPHGGESIRDVPVGRAMERALAAVGDLLPRSEFRDAILEPLLPRHPDESLGAAMTRLLFAMFGDSGLLVIEPRDLPPAAFEVLPKWFARADQLRGRIRSVCDHLTDVGFDVTLDPSTTLMFTCGPGRARQALADGEEHGAAADLSPGVLLRPLWQDAVLPSIGFVVGPGELGYLAIVGSLYKTLGVPRPAFVPRASLTLVERSLVKQMERFGWDVPDLAEGPDALAHVLENDGDSQSERGLQETIDDVQRRLAAVGEDLRSGDQAMVGPLERARTKVIEELDRLLQKVRNSRQNRQGTGLRQIRRLCANLRPRGRLQERVLTALPFLTSHGFALAEHLVDAADPFCVQHGVLEL